MMNFLQIIGLVQDSAHRKGEPNFVGAANRDASITTSENKLKAEILQKEAEQCIDDNKLDQESKKIFLQEEK
jgi:hypothetical protein